MAENERIYTIPLGKAYDYKRVGRARRAVKIVRSFLCRHMKAEEGAVRISSGINSLVLAQGMQKPPRKVKVRVLREDGLVKAYLMDEKPPEKKEKAKKEEKIEEKPKEAEGGKKQATEKEVPKEPQKN